MPLGVAHLLCLLVLLAAADVIVDDNGRELNHLRLLSVAECEHFLREGYVVVRQGVPWIRDMQPTLLSWMSKHVKPQNRSVLFNGPWPGLEPWTERGASWARPVLEQFMGHGRFNEASWYVGFSATFDSGRLPPPHPHGIHIDIGCNFSPGTRQEVLTTHLGSRGDDLFFGATGAVDVHSTRCWRYLCFSGVSHTRCPPRADGALPAPKAK